MMEPRSGLSSPTRVLSSTDLPVPDGPSMTEISPAGSVRETSCQITCRPKDLVSPSTWISTPTPHLAGRLPTGNDRAANWSRGGARRRQGSARGAGPVDALGVCAGCACSKPAGHGPERARGDRPECPEIAPHPGLRERARVLLVRDGGPGALEGGLGLVCGLLVDLLRDRLWGAVAVDLCIF